MFLIMQAHSYHARGEIRHNLIFMGGKQNESMQEKLDPRKKK